MVGILTAAIGISCPDPFRFEAQRYRASGLNLVTAAIVLWNTVYLERTVQAMHTHSFRAVQCHSHLQDAVDKRVASQLSIRARRCRHPPSREVMLCHPPPMKAPCRG